MRNAIRSLLIALSAIGLVTCADVTGGTRPGGLVRATFALTPRFEPSASLTAASLAQLGLEYDSVRVVIVRLPTDTLKPPTETLRDTTIRYHSTDSPVTLELSVLAVPGEQLRATVQYKSGATVLFEGKANVTATPANVAGTPANAVSITVKYTGPGATATRFVLSPGAGTYASGIVTQFTAKAFDAGNVELVNVQMPITWSVSDASAATIEPLTGALTPKVARGTVTVTATLGSLSASATVNFVPLPTRLRVVQGAAQTGLPGSQLLPVIVEAVAADGLPGLGGGLTATFVATNGGSVTPPSSVAFGADGRAQALFTLGPNAGGVYLYTVTACGSPPCSPDPQRPDFSLIVPEIAKVGTATQLIPSGATTFEMMAGVPPNPLPTLRVADALGNSVPGELLQVTVKKGATQVVSFSVPADTIGLLTVNVSVIVPTEAGTYTITISSTAVPSITPLVYNVTIVPATASKLVFGQQPTTAVANAVITPAVTVFIQDQYGNTVTSATSQVTMVLDPATTAGMQFLGTKIVNAVNGVATFSGLSMTPAKTAVRVIATASGLTQALSAPFNITP
jgi:hypothetical protein